MRAFSFTVAIIVASMSGMPIHVCGQERPDDPGRIALQRLEGAWHKQNRPTSPIAEVEIVVSGLEFTYVERIHRKNPRSAKGRLETDPRDARRCLLHFDPGVVPATDFNSNDGPPFFLPNAIYFGKHPDFGEPILAWPLADGNEAMLSLVRAANATGLLLEWKQARPFPDWQLKELEKVQGVWQIAKVDADASPLIKWSPETKALRIILRGTKVSYQELGESGKPHVIATGSLEPGLDGGFRALFTRNEFVPNVLRKEAYPEYVPPSGFRFDNAQNRLVLHYADSRTPFVRLWWTADLELQEARDAAKEQAARRAHMPQQLVAALALVLIISWTVSVVRQDFRNWLKRQRYLAKLPPEKREQILAEEAAAEDEEERRRSEAAQDSSSGSDSSRHMPQDPPPPSRPYSHSWYDG